MAERLQSTDAVAILRRDFLRGLMAAGAALSSHAVLGRYARADVWVSGATPLGALVPVAAVDDPRVVLALPPEFRYRIVSDDRRIMSDGRRVPRSTDGMAAFGMGGFVRLVRNHELERPGSALISTPSYDVTAPAGTTTLIVDPVTRKLVRDFVSLSGTLMNCSGGPTPWDSWLSCEETQEGVTDGYARPHGYVFEVAASSEGPVAPVPLVTMGRFRHEAAVVEPRTGVVYMTEDSHACGFYRFVPNVPGVLTLGGRLQMLAVTGAPRYNTERGQTVGVRLPVEWVEIEDADPPFADAARQLIYDQGRAFGGARFRRLEGAALGDGSVYFASTTGGDRELGQLWRYTPHLPPAQVSRRRRAVAAIGTVAAERTGELTLLYESTTPTQLHAPDNLCLSPHGAVVICEDAPRDSYLRVLSPSGQMFDFARIVLPGYEEAELAGATFSPDGQTLFVNVYDASMTLAIWGPWERLLA